MPRMLRAAAVQMNCNLGQIAHNLPNAEELIASLVQKGGLLVLFLELMFKLVMTLAESHPEMVRNNLGGYLFLGTHAFGR